MKVEFFALCDYAAVDAAGKLNVIGVFDSVNAQELPITINSCAIVVRFRFSRADEGFRSVRITVADTDGKLVLPAVETQIPVQIAGDNPTATAQIVSTVMQLRLPNFGEYSFQLAVDGQQVSSYPLYVTPVYPTFLPHPPPQLS